MSTEVTAKHKVCPECGGAVESVTLPGTDTTVEFCVGKCADEERARDTVEKRSKEYVARQVGYDRLFNDEFYGVEFAGESFDRIERDEYNDKALKTFWRYIEMIDSLVEKGSAIAVFGTAGVGKTKMLCAFSSELRRLQYTYVILTFKRLFDLSTWVTARDNKKEMLDALRSCQFLLLDDVGRGKFTEKRNEELFDIIDYRWKARKPIFFTTNHETPEDLVDFFGDMGIVDRLLENVNGGRQVAVVSIVGPSRRRNI